MIDTTMHVRPWPLIPLNPSSHTHASHPHTARAQVHPPALYASLPGAATALQAGPQAPPGLGQGVVWTDGMRRMYVLLDRALEAGEPVLLVGETGTGKTTACQVAAHVRGQALIVINCNQHTETADFLGGYRPTRCVV